MQKSLLNAKKFPDFTKEKKEKKKKEKENIYFVLFVYHFLM